MRSNDDNQADKPTRQQEQLMAQNDLSSQDFATSVVPTSHTVGGVSIGMINGNLAFAVPGLITGIEIGAALGLQQSIWAFLLGGFILSILGVVTGSVGQKNRLTSYMTMRFVFGHKGFTLLSLAFVLSLLGWYGVNIDLFSEVSQTLLLNMANLTVSIGVLEVLLGVFITATTIWGFVLLERISRGFVPLLALILLYMLFQALSWDQPASHVSVTTAQMTFGEAVSIVVGSFIVSVVLMPDFTRFAKTPKDTVTASFLPFMGISTFVYLISAFAAVALVEFDVLNLMLTLGLGFAAFLLLIVSSWVTNVVNLYSIGLGLKAIAPKFAQHQLIILSGALGTVFATFNLLDSFTDFLFSLAIIFTPVSAIYVTDFFVVRQRQVYSLEELDKVPDFNYLALLSWAGGVGLSYLLDVMSWTLSGVPAVDAFVLTALLYWLASQLIKQRT